MRDRSRRCACAAAKAMTGRPSRLQPQRARAVRRASLSGRAFRRSHKSGSCVALVGAPEGATESLTQQRPSQPRYARLPDACPIRIVLDTRDQSGTDRIFQHVTCGHFALRLVPYRAIMKPSHPDRFQPGRSLDCRTRRDRFHTIHQMRQRLIARQAQQHMQMIRHQYPADRGRIPPCPLLLKQPADACCDPGRLETAPTLVADGGDEVVMIRQRHPSSA